MPSMIKQVIAIRIRYPDGKGGFFKPRFGKLAAQVAHASMKVFLDRKEPMSGTYYFEHLYGGLEEMSFEDFLVIPLTSEMQKWIEGIFTKVVVTVDSEEELLALRDAAETARLPVALITDVGATEFKAPCPKCGGRGTIQDAVQPGGDGEAPYTCDTCGGSGKVGVPTHTAVAIGPAEAADIDPITGHLKLA